MAQNDPMSELRTSTKATKIELKSQADAPPSFVVTTENSATGKTEQVTASHVISTIPACSLSPAVRGALPGLAAALDEIKFVDMAMVHVGFHERAHSTDGFGYLVPTSERERMLGVVFDSNTFPVQNSAAGSPESEDQTRLTVMAGGAHFPDILTKSESEIRSIALDALRRHIGIKKTPDLARVLTMQNAIPQYHVGFESTLGRVEKAARQAPGLLLGGNSLYGIGLADCVTRSKQLAMDFSASIAANGRAAR
jgi:oxygen-dependent protoporphyrinogen oxidase